jgi:hypothetical protein
MASATTIERQAADRAAWGLRHARRDDITDMIILLRAILISTPVPTCKLLKKDGLILVAMLRSQQNDEIAADHGPEPER